MLIKKKKAQKKPQHQQKPSTVFISGPSVPELIIFALCGLMYFLFSDLWNRGAGLQTRFEFLQFCQPVLCFEQLVILPVCLKVKR